MIYIIIPCYNEQEVLGDTTEKLIAILSSIPMPTRILFVDDGSKDKTWLLITKLSKVNANVIGLRLSHNVGQQTAIWAGMESCINDADAVICLDADLQDDINMLPRMVQDFQDGYDVVYGVRNNRASDTFFKRSLAQTFYKLMKWLGCEIVEDHADFRLLSKRALQALLSYPERNLFIRCMIPQLGFNTKNEYYTRRARRAGVTKYPFIKQLKFAIDGITNFSTRPIRWIQLMGFTCILVSLGVIAWAFINFMLGKTNQGWPSLLISLWLLCGVVLVSIGIIGEYVGKIYTETKRRPRYFIMDNTFNALNNSVN